MIYTILVFSAGVITAVLSKPVYNTAARLVTWARDKWKDRKKIRV